MLMRSDEYRAGWRDAIREMTTDGWSRALAASYLRAVKNDGHSDYAVGFDAAIEAYATNALDLTEALAAVS